jgi:hypothetical protein
LQLRHQINQKLHVHLHVKQHLLQEAFTQQSRSGITSNTAIVTTTLAADLWIKMEKRLNYVEGHKVQASCF